MRSGLVSLLATALVASSLLMGGASVRGSPELLLNEGFEDDVVGEIPIGWVTLNGDLVTTADRASEGAQSGRISADGPSGRILSTTIPIRPGSDYSLRVSVLQNDPNLQSTRLTLRWKDVNAIDIYPNPWATLTFLDSSWQELAMEEISPPDAAFAMIQIDVNCSGKGVVAYIDDITLQGPPPEPPTETPSETETPTATAVVATPTRSPSPTPSPVPTTGISSLLVNGDFEDGDGDVLSGWSKYGGELSRTSDHCRGGGHSGAFRSDSDSTKWVYQALTISGGAAYQFGIYVLLDNPAAGEVFLRISWYESGDASGSAIATSDSPARLSGRDPSFRYLSTGAVLAPPTASSARLRVMLAPASSAQATVYLDDASVQQVSPDLAATPSPPLAVGDETGQNGDGDEVNSRKPVATPTDSLTPAQGESLFPLEINEVMYDPAQSGNKASSEWVEIYNAGDKPINLAGWTLADNSESDELTALIVPAHGFAVVAASEVFRDEYPAFTAGLLTLDGRIGNGLADKGDRLLLYDPSGRLADGVSWGDDESVLDPSVALIASGHSIERAPAGHDTDKASDFVDNAKPSPGQGMARSDVAGTSVDKKVVDEVASSLQQSEQTSSGRGVSRWLVLLAAGAALATAVWLVVVYRQRLYLKK